MSEFVDKVWGLEEILVNTPLYCAKYLYLQPGYQCSLHRHLVKDETFVVLNGKCMLEFGDDVRYLASGDSQRIAPKTWHRFINHDTLTCQILEVSTHHDDADVERKEPSRKL